MAMLRLLQIMKAFATLDHQKKKVQENLERPSAF